MQQKNTPTTEEEFTHTVHCFDDKSKRQHFYNVQAASKYANKLLRQGHKAKIYPYKPPKKYIDILAERGPNG